MRWAAAAVIGREVRVGLLCLLAPVWICCSAGGPGSVPDDVEIVDLSPLEQAAWTPRNVVAGLTSILGLWNHWYGEKQILIETVPDGAYLSLYYLRSNFQKLFERAESPVLVRLPTRIQSTSADVLKIRVMADGFLVSESSRRVHTLPGRLLIELQPLPNALVFLGQTHLANRTTLTLRTTEEPQVRVAKGRSGDAFTLSLTQTADRLESRPGGGTGYVEEVEVAQLGEDLVLRVATVKPDLEVRSRASYDPVRRSHLLVLDLLERGTAAPTLGQVRREIADVPFTPGDRCHAAFEAALYERLDPQALARALRPSGTVAEFYQRAVMERVGEFARGRVSSRNGETYRIGSAIELAMALQNAGEIKGFLGLMGAAARRQQDPETFLRSLVAPDLGADAFRPIYREAEARWRACR
jgi:hypothetical protein